MTTDTNLSQIVFNRLSNEKYHELKTSGQLNDQQFYITPDLNTNPGLIQDYMSNCITKIPQHINLELSTDGTLTLKAGSVVYIPNGFESDGITKKFEKLTIQNDISINNFGEASAKTFLCAKATAFSLAINTFSGDSKPSTSSIWYDTKNNVINTLDSTLNIIDTNISLPIAIINRVNGMFTSIDQVFNGMGYMGAVAFAVPGVQAIIPNGFNNNSQLNNYTATVERVLLKDYAADGLLGHSLALTLTNSPLLSAGNMIYVEEENQMYKDSISELNKRTEVEIAKVTTDSTRITSLTPLPVYTRILNSTQVYDFGNDLLEKNITNCITAIPQDIKLELNNSTLTLKAGSQSRDGQGNVINTNSDASFTPTSFINNTYALFVQKNNPQGFDSVPLVSTYSGSETPTYTGTFAYYNTTSKKVEIYRNSEFLREASLPIAIYTVVDGKVTSIDQIFNGFGYIGSTIFALPSVEGLVPNGRNTDGSLNNIKFTTTSVVTLTDTRAFSGNIGLNANSIQNFISAYYDNKRNLVLNSSGVNLASALCGTYVRGESGRITAFNPKTTFQAVDSNDALWASTASKPSNKSITYSLGASGSKYTISANGWFYFIIMSGKANAQATIINNTTGMQSRCLGNDDTGLTLITSLPVKAGDSITVNYTATGSAELKLFLDEGAL